MLFRSRKRTVAEWLEELGDDFLVGPLNTIADTVKDPQVLARDMIVELPTWTGGTLKVSNSPVKLSRTPAGPQGGASRPGEHSVEILGEVGFTDDQVSRFVEAGIVGTGPVEE